jgi:hypothetical protein
MGYSNYWMYNTMTNRGCNGIVYEGNNMVFIISFVLIIQFLIFMKIST